jgi:hypothetical protein
MTAAVPPEAPVVVRRSLIDRVKAILLTPHAEWRVIDGEPATIRSLFTGYALILSAIPAIMVLLSGLAFKNSALASFGFGPAFFVRLAITQYIAGLIGIYVLGLVIDALAPSFGGQKAPVQAMKVAVYSATASWIASIFSSIPHLGILGLLGLYSLYLLFSGLPILMKSPADRSLLYTVVVVVVAIIIMVAVSWLVGMVTGTSGAFRPGIAN